MLEHGFSTETVREGSASIIVPKIDRERGEPLDHAISKAPVFYNPIMKLNRDLAVVALNVHQMRLSKRISACEPMCGTGVRGVRLALEVPNIDKIVLSDVNPLAIDLAKKNAQINGLSDRIKVRFIEANLLMALHSNLGGRFDYVDLDPYGSPVTYIDSALRSCRNNGMLALTATDMAPLCGVNPKACIRKYGGLPLRTEYCHETAVRLLTGVLVRVASRFDVSVTPLFSYAADHYIRIYAKIERGAKKSDYMLKGIGYILHCFNCFERRIETSASLMKGTTCEVCGGDMKISGPMWIGELADDVFVTDMINFCETRYPYGESRIVNLLRLVRDEVNLPPTFFNIDRLCSRLGMESLAAENIINALTESNFMAVRTHFDNRGVKTNAPISRMNEILRSMSKGGKN